MRLDDLLRLQAAREPVEVRYHGLGKHPEHPDLEEDFHHLTAHVGGSQVGFMTLFPSGMVDNVEVDPSHQRQGVATALWRHAETLGLNPEHSEVQTDEGAAWAAHVGVRLEDVLGDLAAAAGKGKPRHQPGGDDGRAAQDAPGGVGADDGGRVPQAEPLAVVEHPQVKKDLRGVHPRIVKKYDDVVSRLAAGERFPSTHPLVGPFKGWEATDLDWKHRVVHRVDGDSLHVGYVGVHYEGMKPRLGAHQEPTARFFHADSSCPVCFPSGRTAAAPPNPLRNPTGGLHWYHGTSFDPSDDEVNEIAEQRGHREPDPGGYLEHSGEHLGDGESISNKHWNTDLGLHFTSLHHVAHEFAAGRGHPRQMARVAHTFLHMANPAHYEDERKMGEHAIEVARSRKIHFVAHPDDHEAHEKFMAHDPSRDEWDDEEDEYRLGHAVSASHQQRMTWSEIDRKGVQPHHSLGDIDSYLGMHPERADVAHEFRQHLERRGHDGVTYGNNYEGPKGHICATPFSHEAAHVRRWQWLHPDQQHRNDNGHPAPWSDALPGLEHLHAHVLTDWAPKERVFAPTKENLDPRLFREDGTMLPAVRVAIMDVVTAFWRPRYGDFSSWARVYLAGSEASKWWGNNDFDLLIGVDYDAYRKATGDNRSNVEITQSMNRELSAGFNDEQWHPPFDPDTEWHRTGYVNKDSYDIRNIKPYAAYDVSNGTWAVHPPEEPEGHRFNESEWYFFEGVAERIKHILALPEPARTTQAKRMYDELHADRSRAFGPLGTGVFDRGNVLEKYLDQAGLWAPLQAIRYDKHPLLTQPYSQAFTAEGFNHDEPRDLALQRHGLLPGPARTAALHDLTRPEWPRHNSWDAPHEKEQKNQEHERAYSEFHAGVAKELGRDPETLPKYEAQSHWENGIRRAISTGKITHAQAKEKGYRGDAREEGDEIGYDWEKSQPIRRGGWAPLPHNLYHATTNLDAVVDSGGLKTRHELGMGARGHGLGGGSDHTISVTTDHGLAHDVYHSLHEYHAFLNGKISEDDLYNVHHGGAKPHEIRKNVESSVGKERMDQVRRGMTSSSRPGAYGPDGSDADKSPDPFMTVAQVHAKHGTDWRIKPGHEPINSDADPERHMYPSHSWERPMTPDEHVEARSAHYKAFSHARGWQGGHRDPLFISNDPAAFAKADPRKFGILHLRPAPGGHGYPLHGDGEHRPGADSGEWRTHSGDAMEMSGHFEAPYPRHQTEQDEHAMAQR